MIMADVLTYFLLIAGSILVLNAYWLAAASLAPKLVDECQAHYARPWLITGIGLLLVIPVVGLARLIGEVNHPFFKLLSILLLAPAVISGMAGSAGLARRIGQGLVSAVDHQQPWRRILRGGLVLAFTLLLPFIGWFVLFPWTLISGLGAVGLALRGWRRAKANGDSTATPVANAAPPLSTLASAPPPSASA